LRPAPVLMSSAGRPDILQCVRCRDRDSDIAVLLMLKLLKHGMFHEISHGISPGITHGISHGIFHGISHGTSHGDPVVYPMGHAMGYPKGFPIGYPSGYPIGYPMGYPMHLSAQLKLLHPAASWTEPCLEETTLAEPSGLLLSVAVPTALNGLLPHCRCAATLSTCYALLAWRHGPCRKPWLASHQRQQQTPTRTCTISITGFPE
jgi:hypothetical protein